MRSVFKSFFISIVMLFLLTAGGKSEDKQADSRTVLAVSIVPQKTFVEAVARQRAKVVVMIPPGFSPGNYEPKPMEIEKFSKAKIYFAIGVPAEKTNILPKAKNTKIVFLNNKVAEFYPNREFSPGKTDPHIWLSPKRVKVMVEIIAREMSIVDPVNKNEYAKNAGKYIKELDKLDREIKKTVREVKNRKFIVFHPAYGYLADDYRLEMHALEQDGKEASPARLREMIDFAKKENIKAIFYQAEISSRQAQSFADEIWGKTVQIDPLSPDYTENLKRMTKLFSQVMK